MAKTKTDTHSGSIIIGSVYDRDGRRLGGAEVTCGELSVLSNFDGAFKFEGLAAGNYDVIVALKGFETCSKTVKILGNGKIVFVNFYIDKARGNAKICGYIYDAETKNPITVGGTAILILPASNRYVNVDKNGYYEFADLEADTYEIWASALGYQDKKITVDVKEEEVKSVNFYVNPEQEPVEEVAWG